MQGLKHILQSEASESIMSAKPLPRHPKHIPSLQLQLLRRLSIRLRFLPLLRPGDVQQLVKPLLHHCCNLTDFRISAIKQDGVVNHQVDVSLQSIRRIVLVSIQFLFDRAQIPRVLLWNDIEVCRDLQQYRVDRDSEDKGTET